MKPTLLLSFLLATSAHAQPPQPALPPSTLFASSAPESLSLEGRDVAQATRRVVEIQGREGLPADATFTRAVEVSTRAKPENPWFIQLRLPTSAPIAQGQAMMVSFWARGTQALDPNRVIAGPGDELARVVFLAERSAPPWEAAGETTATLDAKKWKLVRIVTGAPGDFPTGRASLNFRLGFWPQTVQIAHVEARVFGSDASLDGLRKIIFPPRPRREPPPPGRNLPFWAPPSTFTGTPQLREQISLNGTWKFSIPGKRPSDIPVPEYWDARPGFDTEVGIYEREVQVPAAWKQKRVVLEFEGVASSAQVLVDGVQVHEHVGAWIPFRVELPNAKAGQKFNLQVIVKGGLPPTSDAQGRPLWPVGWFGLSSRWGICFPVWLRAYGEVSIEDAFIQTSVEKKTLTVDYTLRNSSRRARTVKLIGDVPDDKASSFPKKLVSHFAMGSAPVTLQAGETRVVRVTNSWPRPLMWSPEEPTVLRLVSTVQENGEFLDSETRRFGFREMKIRGGQFVLNGVPIVLLGESTNTHAQGYDSGRYKLMSPEKWGATIERMKAMHINILRLHMSPAPDWMLDMADEKGLMILPESAVYAKEYIRGADKPKYLENSRAWLQSWVRGSRNHPSVIGWSAENEMGVGWLRWMTTSEMKSLGDAILKVDPTRYVSYDGDRDMGHAPGESSVNWHYPEGYLNEPKGSIYSWASKISPGKPTGIGEFITSYGKNERRNRWWQGTWTRGLRYTGWTDVRPYTLGWAYESEAAMKTPQAQNLRNSFAPVALFDLAYDDLGVDPLLDIQKRPELKAGEKVTRSLVLYNNEPRGESVTAQVLVRVAGQALARGEKQMRVELGGKRDLKISFQVPPRDGVRDGVVEVVLRTSKDGKARFEESRFFRAVGAFAGAPSTSVSFE